MIAYGAREESGINKMLTYRSLVIVRLVTSTLGYLCLSVSSFPFLFFPSQIHAISAQFFYTLLNLAFKLDIWHKCAFPLI